jgi:hypothetical protein
MMADFSGVERAGQAIGQGLANAGAQIGETIKKRNENEKEVAGGIKMATAMKKAVPALGEMADEVIANLSNPDLSTNEKLLALSGVKEAMQMSLLGNQENRAEAALKIQQDQLALEAAKIRASMNAPKKVTKSTIGLGDGGEMDVLIDEQGNMTDVFGNPISGQRTQAPKGAGANIQNALPQGQGGTFPDGVPTAELPIDQTTEFTPGVSVDGTPGVLPSKDGTPTTPVYGVRSPKSTEKFRPATKEELALYGAPAGQVDEKSGKFYPLNPPSGMRLESDGKGGFTLVQGSGVGEKAQGAAEARKRISEQGLGVVLENLGSVYDQINKVAGSTIGAKAQEGIAALFPASDIGAIKDQIETVNNNISFDTVNQLRASSTTGSAGGNITEKEWPRFEGRLGKIYVGQNKDLFTKNVKSIAYTMYDAVNGTPEEVDKLLDENKITQQDYNNYLAERSALRMKFGAMNLANPLEKAKQEKAADNPLNLSPEAQEILNGLPE